MRLRHTLVAETHGTGTQRTRMLKEQGHRECKGGDSRDKGNKGLRYKGHRHEEEGTLKDRDASDMDMKVLVHEGWRHRDRKGKDMKERDT